MNWLSAHYEWVVGVVLVPIVLIFIKHRLDSRKTPDTAIPQLQRENTELQNALDAAQAKLKIRESVEKRGVLFYKSNELEPLCPVCWQRDEKIVYLPPSYEWGGGVRRDCQVCHQTSWEVPMRRR